MVRKFSVMLQASDPRAWVPSGIALVVLWATVGWFVSGIVVGILLALVTVNKV